MTMRSDAGRAAQDRAMPGGHATRLTGAYAAAPLPGATGPAGAAALLPREHDSVIGPVGAGAPLLGAGGRTNQKTRTRKAILDACRELIRAGTEVTMPQVAREALVSEATAYRYFPDLVSLIKEALEGLWPPPAQALEPVAASTDPAERVAFACEYLLRGVHAYQGAVRAMMSQTIVSPGRAHDRPGVRFGLIDEALAPFAEPGASAFLEPEAMSRLKLDLAVAVSAEALFILTDLCGLPTDDAIVSAVRTATTLTKAAFTALAAGGSGYACDGLL